MAYTSYDLINSVDTGDMRLFYDILDDRDNLGRPRVNINRLNDAGLSALIYIAKHSSTPKIRQMFLSLLALRDHAGDSVVNINTCYAGAHLVYVMLGGICNSRLFYAYDLLNKVLNYRGLDGLIDFRNHVADPVIFQAIRTLDSRSVQLLFDHPRGRGGFLVTPDDIGDLSEGRENYPVWGTARDYAANLSKRYSPGTSQHRDLLFIQALIKARGGHCYRDMVLYSSSLLNLRLQRLRQEMLLVEQAEARAREAMPRALAPLVRRTWGQWCQEFICRSVSQVEVPGPTSIVDKIDVALASLGFMPVDDRNHPRARAYELAMADEAVMAERYLVGMAAGRYITLRALNQCVALLDSGHILRRQTINTIIARGGVNPITRAPLRHHRYGEPDTYRSFTAADVDLLFLNWILNITVRPNPSYHEANLRSMKAPVLVDVLRRHRPVLSEVDLLNLSKLNPVYINEAQLRGLLAIPRLVVDYYVVNLINSAHATLPEGSPVPLLSQDYLNGVRASRRAAHDFSTSSTFMTAGAVLASSAISKAVPHHESAH